MMISNFLTQILRKQQSTGCQPYTSPVGLIKFLAEGMANTVVAKLLGRNIGYTTLYNKVCTLWKPTKGLQLVDVENGYFLAKLQNKEDFERALRGGPWIVYGQYLTVQPWTIDFDTNQAYPNLVMAWVRFPGLLGHMYRKQILWEIGGLVRESRQTRSQHREWRKGEVRPYGYFYQLGQSLNFPGYGRVQQIEYEHLPMVCFSCGHYGHVKEICPKIIHEQNQGDEGDRNKGGEGSLSVPSQPSENSTELEAYGPWMLIERKGRRGPKAP